MAIEKDYRFLAQLKKHEGCELKAYRCTEGHLTIGYGHNLDDNPIYGFDETTEITQEQAEEILHRDLWGLALSMDANKTLAKRWRRLSEPRQAVLLNMAFNMGVPRLLKFKLMLDALWRGDFSTAAKEALDSRWRRQVKKRALELAAQLESGEWQDWR